MGITIFMLKFGQPPFIAGTIIHLYHKIQNDPLVFPSQIDPSLQDLLIGMLQKDPESRFELNTVIQHPWLRHPPVFRAQTSQTLIQHFKPPDNYDHEERIAMEGPIHTVNNEDIYHSIAFGTRSKQKVKADQLKAAEHEDIMATNWGDDVFEQISDNGFESDSEDDESYEAVPSRRQAPALATTSSTTSKEMSDFEVNERANRFRSNATRSKEDIVPHPGSPEALNILLRAGDAVEDAIDATEVSMADFERMMDTLAMQPLRAKDSAGPKTGSLQGLDEGLGDEDEHIEDITGGSKDGKIEVISQFQNRTNGIAAAFHSEQGQRQGQEDRCLLAINASKIKALETSGAPVEFFEVLANFTVAGIFDGHNGSTCAQYVVQQLPPKLILHKNFLGKPAEMEIALLESFRSVDESACSFLKQKKDNSGSTGLIAVYDGRKHVLTVANVGDSVCILSRAGRAVSIHRTHRLDSVEERGRITAMGGTVVNSRV